MQLDATLRILVQADSLSANTIKNTYDFHVDIAIPC
jgi:hypothetical protein